MVLPTSVYAAEYIGKKNYAGIVSKPAADTSAMPQVKSSMKAFAGG